MKRLIAAFAIAVSLLFAAPLAAQAKATAPAAAKTDKLDLNMRVNANLPFGFIMYPISKIFEYHGTGPMKNPKWVPKNL